MSQSDTPATPIELESASLAFRRKDYITAAEIYGRLADKDHVESIVMLGWLQLNGFGLARDEAKAIDSFRRAARLGSSAGQFYYARYLTKVAKHVEAFPLYRSASATGHLPSTFWVGYSAARGLGIEKNVPQAYQFLLLAASRGHLQALREISVLDIHGNRGFWWRFLAPLTFTVAVIGAFVVGIAKPESDVLRA